MKNLYFDLIGGISGDMIVASLLDIVKDLGYLKKELKKLKVKEYVIVFRKSQAGHISARRFIVNDLTRQKRVFQLDKIKNIIKNSKLTFGVKNNIIAIYDALYRAEKSVHGGSHAHFEQIGEIDSLIDIASSCILIDKLEVDKIFYSSIPFGRRVAAATAFLLKSKDVYFSNHQFENITPTGVAIVTILGSQLKQPKTSFSIQKVGYGTGIEKSDQEPNVLRAALLSENNLSEFESDEIIVIQCNIDDMSPQILGFVMERLYKAGALEVFFENVYTKKSRLGILISVLSKYETLDTIADIIFRETTTIGIRYFKASRLKLKRSTRIVKSSLGSFNIKEVTSKGYKKIIPEYDHCVEIAGKKGMPLREVFEKINFSFNGGK
jgi:uncharacterized protein (TIGR00299 family) protein